MKPYIGISLLFCFVALFCQSKKEDKIKKYNELLNYTPKNFKSNLDSTTFSFPKEKLNTIGKIRLYFNHDLERNYNKEQIQYLQKRTIDLAKAFFEENKKILIKKSGGFGGCSGNLFDSIQLKNQKFIELKFCYTCTDSYMHTNFIYFFNETMYTLTGIERPDAYTHKFNGTFNGKNNYRLVLNKDRTYQFSNSKGDYSEGFWFNKKNTLTLNSKVLDENYSFINYSFSGKWIELKNFKLELKNDKLKGITDGKLKLKKKES